MSCTKIPQTSVFSQAPSPLRLYSNYILGSILLKVLYKEETLPSHRFLKKDIFSYFVFWRKWESCPALCHIMSLVTLQIQPIWSILIFSAYNLWKFITLLFFVRFRSNSHQSAPQMFLLLFKSNLLLGLDFPLTVVSTISQMRVPLMVSCHVEIQSLFSMSGYYFRFFNRILKINFVYLRTHW